MGKSLSITVHPSAQGAEYLTVSDAMRQVLDFIDILEKSEPADVGGRKIVWRLTEAHTNSPPFTVTAEAFSVDPAVSINFQASRVTTMLASGVGDLLRGVATPWVDLDIAAPLKRVFQRNLNGVGRTEIYIDHNFSIDIVPSNAKTAVLTIDRMILDEEGAKPDYTRTEYGSVEVDIVGIVRWNDKPALSVIERLAQEKVTCVLTPDLADQLGPSHKWHEAWDGRRLLVSGALQYGKDGSLKRIDAMVVDEMPWADVMLSELRGIDILQGLSVREHISILRGEDLG